MSSFKIFDIAGSRHVRAVRAAQHHRQQSRQRGQRQRRSEPGLQGAPPGVRSGARRDAAARTAATPRVRVKRHRREPGRADRALRAGQSARERRRLRVRAERQRGRGDGRHDLRLALVPEQRRSDEHVERTDARHPAARPVSGTHHVNRRHHQRHRRSGQRFAGQRRQEERSARPGRVPEADDRAAEEPGSVEAAGSVASSSASSRSSAR